MSTVFEAEDGAGQRVALKLLHPSLVADEAGRARLRREVAALQKVRGMYVAEVLDAETEEDEAFIVTELIDGPTLEQDVADSGVFTGKDLGELADLLGRAVTSVHHAGVLHRDIKPSNVMLGPDGPVLIDFGISQAAEDSRLTTLGSIAHTPGYLDPRVLDGASPDEAADMWALVAVLAFAATGRAPFGGGSPHAIMRRVIEGHADLTGLPVELAHAFASALEPRIDKRLNYEGLREVIDTGVFRRDFSCGLDSGAGLGSASALAAGVGQISGEGNADTSSQAREEAPYVPEMGSAEAGTADQANQSLDRFSGVQAQSSTSIDMDNQRMAGQLGGQPGFSPEQPGLVSAGETPTQVLHGGPTQVLPAESPSISPGQTASFSSSTEVIATSSPTQVFPSENAVPPTAIARVSPVEQMPPTAVVPSAFSSASQRGGGYRYPEAYVPSASASQAYPDYPYAPSSGMSGEQISPMPESQEAYPAMFIEHFLGKNNRMEQWTPRWLEPPKKARWLTFLSFIALLAFSSHYPLIGVVAYAVLLCLTGIIGVVRIDLNKMRLSNGGPQAHEGLKMAVRLPWFLVKTGVNCALSLAMGLACGVGCAWAVTSVTVDDPRVIPAVFAGVTMLISWWSVTALPSRLGARSVYEEVAPSGFYSLFWTLVLLALAVAGFFVWGESVSWAPLQSVPSFLK